MFIPSCPRDLLSNCFDWITLYAQTHLPIFAVSIVCLLYSRLGDLEEWPTRVQIAVPGSKWQLSNRCSTSLKSSHYPYSLHKTEVTKCFPCQDKWIFSWVDWKGEKWPEKLRRAVISYRDLMVLLFPQDSCLFCSWYSFFTEDAIKNMLKTTRASQRVSIKYNWRTDHTERNNKSLVLLTLEIFEKSGFHLNFFYFFHSSLVSWWFLLLLTFRYQS